MNHTIKKLAYFIFTVSALAIATQYLLHQTKGNDSYDPSQREMHRGPGQGNGQGPGAGNGSGNQNMGRPREGLDKIFVLDGETHGYAMFFCWSVFAFFQIISARFMKHLYVLWVVLHVILGSAVLIVSFINITPYISFHSTKGVFGLIVTILMILLAVSGIGDLVTKCDKKCFLKPYIVWQWIHKITAWVNQPLALIPQIIGIRWLKLADEWIIGLILLNIAMAAVVIILQIAYKKGLGSQKMKLRQPNSQDNSYTFQRLMKETHQDGKQLVVLDNKVIDVKGFSKFHPGGRALIEINYGTDVGRYFYGVYAQTPQYINYPHSAYSLRQFQNKVIGVMKQNFQIIANMFNLKGMKDGEGDPFSSYSVDGNLLYNFKITERKQITSLITRVTFSNGKLRKILLNDQRSWGKHFKYTAKTEHGKKTRFYTFAFAIGKQSLRIHRELLSAFNQDRPLQSQNSINLQVEGIDAFPKLYDYPKAFSRFLHQIPLNSQLNSLNIDGPLGVGLGLQDGDNGKYLAISAGTGIVPFIDLAFYLFRRNVRRASENRIVAFQDQELNLLGDDFKFDLWGTFRSEDQVVAHDILEKSAEISKNNGFDNFNFNLRLSKRKDPRWDQKYITQNVDQSAKRIFVRGPQQFNWMIEKYLVNAGYPSQNILHI